MVSPQKRAKSWGYQVEVQALNGLRSIWPGVRRTGSMAYKRAAADLVGEAAAAEPQEPVLLVVTKDKGPGNPLLVTLSMADLDRMVHLSPRVWLPVRVQVKGRARSWIGTLWRELRESVKAEERTGTGKT